jgi:hypothetical protein
MSGAAAGSNHTAKLQEDKKPEADPTKTSQQPSQPNILEEDDEFEDFPVEGKPSRSWRVLGRFPHVYGCADISPSEQTGRKKRPKYLEAMHTFGRRAGMTTMRMKTFRSN